MTRVKLLTDARLSLPSGNFSETSKAFRKVLPTKDLHPICGPLKLATAWNVAKLRAPLGVKEVA